MTMNFPRMPEQMTKSESVILDYISGNPEEFLFSSIGEVGKKLGVSVTTISRFVRRMGCEDYKDFKRLVAEHNLSEGPAGKMLKTLSTDDGFSAESWLMRQQMYVEKTIETLNTDEFKKASEAVLHARRVFIHGKSASYSLAYLLMFRLRRLGIDAVLLPSGGSEVAEGLATAVTDDLVIMFSFSKVSREGRMILDCSRETGFKTIAFSSRTFVPEEERADIQLFAYRGEPREYHSMTAPSALVDALVMSVSEQLGERAVHALSKLHLIKKKYDR